MWIYCINYSRLLGFAQHSARRTAHGAWCMGCMVHGAWYITRCLAGLNKDLDLGKGSMCKGQPLKLGYGGLKHALFGLGGELLSDEAGETELLLQRGLGFYSSM